METNQQNDVERPRTAHIAPRNRNHPSADGLGDESSGVISTPTDVFGFFHVPYPRSEVPERREEGLRAFLHQFLPAPSYGRRRVPRIRRGPPPLPMFNLPPLVAPIDRDLGRQEENHGVAEPPPPEPNAGAGNSKGHMRSAQKGPSRRLSEEDFARAFGLALPLKGAFGDALISILKVAFLPHRLGGL